MISSNRAGVQSLDNGSMATVTGPLSVAIRRVGRDAGGGSGGESCTRKLPRCLSSGHPGTSVRLDGEAGRLRARESPWKRDPDGSRWFCTFRDLRDFGRVHEFDGADGRVEWNSSAERRAHGGRWLACPPAAPEHRTSRSIVKLRPNPLCFWLKMDCGVFDRGDYESPCAGFFRALVSGGSRLGSRCNSLWPTVWCPRSRPATPASERGGREQEGTDRAPPRSPS